MNNSRVKLDSPKSVMKPKLQEGGKTSGKEKTNNTDSFHLTVSEKSHALKIKIGGASERIDSDSIIKRPLLDRQRLSNIQSHRYKPYERLRRDYNSISHPTTPTSGVSEGNSFCNKNLNRGSPPRSRGVTPIPISKGGSLSPAAILMPPPSRPSSPILSSAGRRTFTQRPKSTSSTPLQSSSFTNQKKIYPSAGKEVLNATLQVVGSVGVSIETQIRRPNPTPINRGSSSRDSFVAGTQTLSQQQDLNLSTASCLSINRARQSVSKKRAKDQLFHHLNEVIDVQVKDFQCWVSKVNNNDCFNDLGNPLFFKH